MTISRKCSNHVMTIPPANALTMPMLSFGRIALKILPLILLLGSAATTQAQSVKVLVETNKGKFTLMLYDDTPLHKEQFLDNVRHKRYNGTLFHRVIDLFMVQGGNLMSRNAPPGADLSQDTLTVSIPAEIIPQQHIHKKGALAAAREGDETNPQRNSSGSQFYIVTGTYQTDLDLSQYEAKTGYTYTPAQREVYKTQGGTPWLDGSYTVFGEVTDGIKVIDKIQRLSTDDHNRPKRDVIIKRMTILP